MSRIDRLIGRYADHIGAPWPQGVAGIQRTLFLVYPAEEERRLRAHLGELELRTRQAGHGWRLYDITDEFPRWMAAQTRYREKYFRRPQLLSGYAAGQLAEFSAHLSRCLEQQLDAADEATVVALCGVSSLFGLASVSSLVDSVARRVRGRLVVLFPGEYDDHKFRLLDARDGWNYRSLAITCD
ncbi:MAG: DUF1788 domain-containing protein [Pseudomonadota bacterium]|nr:DUF1788 domain-containing protein [Pseudomonadota bacterium]